jgi:hypothetical protein
MKPGIALDSGEFVPADELGVGWTAPAQPAAHVQKPAKNEHVADDVSKNGAESNMGVAYAELPEHCFVTFERLYSAAQMRDFADRTHWMRASHALRASSAQAPAGAAPSVTKEQRRLVGVIADKIEDGSLFQSGIYSKKDLARFVRNLLDATPTTAQAAPAAPHPIARDVAADLERSDWTPEEALRWYAAGKHYDTVPNGDGSSSARILDNGAVASNALKSLSRDYAEHKGDVALMAAPAADRTVSHKAQAIPGVEWQCGPQASGFTAQAGESVPAVGEPAPCDFCAMTGADPCMPDSDCEAERDCAASNLSTHSAASAPAESVGRDAPAAGAVAGPTKWAQEEIADGERGIRWVTNEGIHGRPTDHDVREYLERTPTARGCHCDECKQFYPAAPTPAAQADNSRLKDHQIAALVNELRDIAVKFHDTQQLRERIAQVVVPALQTGADSVLEDAASGMAAEYQRWIDFFHKGNGDYNDFLRVELNHDAARKQGANHD